jgi:uncharacterized protein
VKLVFDPTKDAINRAKHGVSLGDAARLDFDRVLAKLDSRADYGEPRRIGYGPIGRRLYCVVFVRSRQHAPDHQSAQGQQSRDQSL